MKYTSKAPLEVINPDDGYNYFFAYYDLQPFDKESKRHLAHRVSFNDRIPTGDDICEIGYISLCDKTFHKLAETRAWNFQQGAMLQWFDEGSIIYNDFRDGDYVSVIKNIDTGAERVLKAPIATLSSDRKWAMSINFPRIWDFRPGYGYANTKDENYDVFAPCDDGIFLLDIEKNEKRLVISYEDIKNAFPEPPFSDLKLVVNHITFNPSGERFVFILRNFPEKTGERWGNLLVTANRDGTDMVNLTRFRDVNSHYHWKNDKDIIIYAGYPTWGIYLLEDITKKCEKLNNELVDRDDIHCIYHPDRTCFIGDGYPQPGESDRSIYLYDFETETSREILKIHSRPVSCTDLRCDLHNRFNPDGTLVSFDSYHTELRSICMFPFNKSELMK